MTADQIIESEFAEALGSTVSGTLQFLNGASDLEIKGDWLTSDLYRAHFSGHLPDVTTNDGTVSVTYPRRPFVRRRHGAVSLNASVSWSIDINRGGAEINADLTRIRLRSFVIQGGASNVTLLLGEPSGVVRLSFDGGVSALTVVRPRAVPAIARIRRGAAAIHFDGQEMDAVGGALQLTTPEADQKSDRYEIDVLGGATSLRVTTA
ncbi:hypothetical protein GCM10010172_02900 [Paractinoplanes ferrugineus]|uniref:DUF2154 domain-containing protein n=1 Tax=Paractinoplanes ferrugineus TaxID=113564 RepID=A0A919MIH6_9ACTN|nr:hypothetical protein [Actinoplanes ferrugineus]GIE13695.1 hypothetical protein Afe05nite_55350 [Actinoplanes ferrugineus]